MADLGKGMKDRARRLCANETTSGMVTGPVWDGEEPAGERPSRSKFAHGGKIAMGKNAAKRLDTYARGGKVKAKGKTTINIIIGDKQATPPAPPPVAPAAPPPTMPPVDAGAAMMAAGAPPGVPAGPPVGPMNRGGTVGFKRGGCVPHRAFGGRIVKKPQGGQGPLSAATKRGRAGLKTGGKADGDGDADDGRGLSKATKTGRKGLYTGGRVGYDAGGPIAPQYGASDPRFSPGWWEMFRRMMGGSPASAAEAPVYRRAPYHDPVYDEPLPQEGMDYPRGPMPVRLPARPVTPTPMSAYGNRVQGPPMPPPRPAARVPMPPPRPADVGGGGPTWLQRVISGQYTAPEIDTSRTFARGGRVGRAFGGPMNAQSNASSSFGATSTGGMPQMPMPQVGPMPGGGVPGMPGMPPGAPMGNMQMPQMSMPGMPAVPNGQPQGTPSQAQAFMQQIAGRNNAALAQARQRWGGGMGLGQMMAQHQMGSPEGASAAPGGFKRGGSVHMTAGARSGEGRLQKARLQKADRC